MSRAAAVASHHHDLLVLQLHRAAVNVAPLLDDPEGANARKTTPGLSMLLRLERAGRITGIHHLRRREKVTPARVRLHLQEATQDAHDWDHGGALLIRVSDRATLARLRQALSRDPYVVHASHVPIRYAQTVASPHTIAGIFPPPRLWHLDRIGWHDARKRRGFNPARRIHVAVLDSGIDTRHPALERRIASYVHRDANLAFAPSSHDMMGHGTHVAGLIAATPTGTMTARGLTQCRVHAFKIFSDEPQLSPALHSFTYVVEPTLLYRALADCIEQELDVVNMSIGGTGPSDPHEAKLIRALHSRGTPVVAAMGNYRALGSPVQYPAALPGVIAVGATDPDDVVAAFSSAGPHIALCAPGVGIWSTLPTYSGPYGYRAERRNRRVARGAPAWRNLHFDAWPGTSMAAPLVTGAVALLRAKQPRLSVDDIRDRLQQTADRVAGMRRSHFTDDYGAGRLNVRRLLAD